MNLLEKLQQGSQTSQDGLFDSFGVLRNPFPPSNRTSSNPHYPIPEDDEAEEKILAFLREDNSEVLVVLGTQGVGKTNFLNYLETEIRKVKDQHSDYYVVRYMADPEPSFDGTIRTIFQELGTPHLKKVVQALLNSEDALDVVKSYDLRQALLALVNKPDDDELFQLCMGWFWGFRVLNAHRENLGVSFRLDTVESRTAVLRDYILLSTKLKVLKGIFLLLDELEKQAGVLGPRAVVRYLSALRAIIDSLPKHLFMIIAITHDAMRRYASALPAFRSRLENQISLSTLMSFEDAQKLASFYLEHAHKEASITSRDDFSNLVTEKELSDAYIEATKASERRGDEGVRQREFLNTLHNIAEKKIQQVI